MVAVSNMIPTASAKKSSGGTPPKPKWQVGTDLTSLQSQFKNEQAELDKEKRLLGKNTTGRLARYNMVKSALDKASAPTTTPPVTTPGAPDATQPVTTPTDSQPVTTQPAADPKKLFPSFTSFIPSNYEASPLYQFQQKEGNKALEQYYASRGLTNSGAEGEGVRKFTTELGAAEADRMLNVAQQEANRYYQMLTDEADRNRAVSNDQWARFQDLLGYSERNDPSDKAFEALKLLAETGNLKRSDLADYMSKNYERPTVGAGGGGGGTSSAGTFIPSFPNNPNQTNSNLLAAYLGAGNNSSTNSIISNLLSGFLK